MHQFRGRVRRSTEEARCFLLSDNLTEEVAERLRIMEEVQDGFTLAQKDLELRGPGEYFGTRQSGMPDLRVASLTDVRLIEQAREEASRLLDSDPQMSRPEHAALRRRLQEMAEQVTGETT